MAKQGPVGGPSVLVEVHRVAGERGAGASALYAFGFREIAEVLGAKLIRVAEAVLEGELEPLSLLELAAARKHGLDWIRSVLQADSSVGRTLRRVRPARETEVLRAKLTSQPRRYGLGDLWAIGHADIAAQLDLDVQFVWNAQKQRDLLITDLSSVLAFVVRHAPTRISKELQLTTDS
jgi:hypothetical protein